jgi:predicted dehydrogenase
MKHISRRRFIEDSFNTAFSAGIAATLASGKLTQHVVAQNQVAANDQLGVAIIGAGGRAGVHGDVFGSDKRIKILYVCDPDINRAKGLSNRIEKKFGYAPEAISDFRNILDKKSIDIVTCASSNHWHALIAIWALQAGKHCYIEKPLSYNIHEGKSIVAAAKKYGLVFQTGTQCRSATNVRDAVEFIRNGGIGEVKLARVLAYHQRGAIGAYGEYPVPNGIDYDLWCGPAPVEPITRKRFHYDWHWQRRFGNGDIGNQGVHQVDTALRLINVDRFPQSVITYGGRLGYDIEMKDEKYRDAGDTANTQVSIYDYGNKSLIVEIHGLKISSPLGIPAGENPGTRIGAIAYGTNGYVVQGRLLSLKENFWWCFSQTFAFDLKGNLIKEFKNCDSKGNVIVNNDPVGGHVTNFIDAVLANDPKKVTADARCGALSAAICHLGNISYYLGENNKISNNNLKQALQSVKSLDDNETTLARTVEHLNENGVDLNKTPLSLGTNLNIDVDKEVFIDNNDANAMMTRDYRPNFVVPEPKDV